MLNISVIIPTLNEAKKLPRLLESLQQEQTPHEIIIADGGSTDDTIAIAQKYHCTVLPCSTGRGQQLRAGATKASGALLLFLHADSIFPSSGLATIAQHMRTSPQLIGGNFRLLFDGGDNFSDWLNGFYARIRNKGYYYGDSGIFVKRTVYQQLGGIKPLALMEDFDFVRKMEATGETLCIANPPLITSSRRFIQRKPKNIIAGWVMIHTLFYLRVPSTLLAKLYRSSAHGKC